MAPVLKHSLSGITRKHWTGFALVALAVALPFVLLYVTSRRVVVNEIRNYAMGVAITAAGGLDISDIEAIRSPEDMARPAYQRLQSVLDRLVRENADIRYAYIMRRSAQPFAPPHAYEYVVDHAGSDFNRDGKLDRDEQSEAPGTAYSAQSLPAMVRAWERADADHDVTPDPPYPDLLSGYAPVRGPDGKTVAMMGVDVTASTVNAKLRVLRVVITAVGLAINVLIFLVIQLYYQQRDAFDRIKELNDELSSRNEMLRQASGIMAGEVAAATGPAPRPGPTGERPAGQARTVFQSFYLDVAACGPDLVDVFDIDDDHAGLIMADTAGRGRGAALLAGLLKMAMSSVREPRSAESSTLYTDLTHPGVVLSLVNDMVVDEIPPEESMAMVYAVVDFSRGRLLVASAGHAWPLRWGETAERYRFCEGLAGAALGLKRGQGYRDAIFDLAEGDRLLFRSGRADPVLGGEPDQFSPVRQAMATAADQTLSGLTTALAGALRAQTVVVARIK